MTASTRHAAARTDHKVGRVVVPRHRIAQRVGELGQAITRDYDGREVTVLAVMNGAAVFLADLIRHLPLPLRIETTAARSYHGPSVTAGPLHVAPLPAGAFAGRHVLVVDDILDTGRTLQAVTGQLAAADPASLSVCVLLRKRRPGPPPAVAVHYVGFEIADEFVVGYGLDYDDLHRNLPDLCVLQRAPEERP